MSVSAKETAVEVALRSYDVQGLTICSDPHEVRQEDDGFYVKAWVFVPNWEILTEEV